MEADYPYEEWGSGPPQAMALIDLSGTGTPELVLFFPGGGKSDAAVGGHGRGGGAALSEPG